MPSKKKPAKTKPAVQPGIPADARVGAAVAQPNGAVKPGKAVKFSVRDDGGGKYSIWPWNPEIDQKPGHTTVIGDPRTYVHRAPSGGDMTQAQLQQAAARLGLRLVPDGPQHADPNAIPPMLQDGTRVTEPSLNIRDRSDTVINVNETTVQPVRATLAPEEGGAPPPEGDSVQAEIGTQTNEWLRDYAANNGHEFPPDAKRRDMVLKCVELYEASAVEA